MTLTFLLGLEDSYFNRNPLILGSYLRGIVPFSVDYINGHKVSVCPISDDNVTFDHN